MAHADYSFIIGEHGFYPNTSQWDYFYQLQKENPVAGSLVWGLRGHTDEGGFETHSEGGGIYSYHVPGWYPTAVADFDSREQYIVAKTYTASYEQLGETVPFYPTPWAPTIFAPNTTSNGTAFFQFVGGAWGDFYEVWHAPTGSNGTWTQAVNFLYDNVDSGSANYTVDAEKFGNGNGSWVMRGVSTPPLLTKGPWSNVVSIAQ